MRNHRQIISKIHPDWDSDLHIHTNWSEDNLNGPNMRNWAEYGEKFKIHLGFADHFEYLHYRKSPTNVKNWRINPTTIESYLEEFDQVKSDFPHISSGLEIEYFPTILSQIEAFIDDYGNQFDFLIGSIHHLTESVGITIKPEFQLFLEKNKSLGSILSQYFNLEMEMVRLDIFDAIAHPDVIFRHCPTEVITPSDVQSAIHSLQDLAQLCIRKKIFFEINLSTFNSSYNSISPSKELVSQFVSIDTPLFIGSDSHSLQNFQERVVNIRKFNNIVRNEWLFEKKL